MNDGTHVGEDTSGNDNGDGPWSLFQIVVMPPSIEVVPRATFVGQTVGLYNPHNRKFASMLGAPTYRTSASQVMAPTLPASHTWERFQVTDGYNGRIALYSAVHRRFVAAEDRDQWEASGERPNARLGGPNWHREQFEIWRRRDLGPDIYNIYSPMRNRFMRINGNHVGTSGSENGWSNEARWRIIPFTCNLGGNRPRGYWHRVGSGTTNSWDYSYTEGRDTQDSNTRDSSWSSSVERSVSSTLEVHVGQGGIGSDILGAGVTASNTVSLSRSESRSQSQSVSRAISHSVSASSNHRATAPGAFWQYTVRVQDSCGVSNLRTQDLAFVRAEAGSGPPCCLPNNFADASFTHGPCLPGSTCFGCAPEVCNGTAPNTSPQTYNNCPGFCTHGLTASNLFQRCQGGAQASSCQNCRFCREGRLPATGI